MRTTTTIPHSDVDIFSETVMRSPFATFRELRNAGPVVYLDRFDAFAVPRYNEVRKVLGDWESFSAEDIALNKEFNERIGDGILRADPPLHDQLRSVLASKLSRPALRDLQSGIERRADEIVGNLATKGSFDAVADLARRLPVEIVGDLIGLPTEGREHLLDLIDANFNCFGPINSRTLDSLPQLRKLSEYVTTYANRNTLSAGSMGRAVFDAVDAGQISESAAPRLLMAYVTGGMDTTVHAIGHIVWLLSQHPKQWQTLKENPTLVPQAFREILRYESPVQIFGRTTRVDWSVENLTVPAGSRLAVLYGSANRDERKWENPDRFDITRTNFDHLAFGYGLHGCAGQALARIEGEAIIHALLRRVSHIHTSEPVRHFNNTLRGLKSLPVIVTTEN